MTPQQIRYLQFAIVLVAAVLCFANVAQAGPPLICHTIEIGQAKSLPWISHDWNLSGGENYDTKNLVRETLDILGPDTPVLVRMETLRRPPLYARTDPPPAQKRIRSWPRTFPAISWAPKRKPCPNSWPKTSALNRFSKGLIGRARAGAQHLCALPAKNAARKLVCAANQILPLQILHIFILKTLSLLWYTIFVQYSASPFVRTTHNSNPSFLRAAA